ncbi:MAG: type II secretion system F family protein [Phycisphaerales bacterium]|nr:MAG: type II secretion system F family protein [Phycisphaerales bacterium]
MGNFSYRAVDGAGGHVAGTIEATDRRSAVAALAEQGHFVTDLVEEGKSAGEELGLRSLVDLGRAVKLGGRRITSKDILAITTQLSTALRAGLPLLNGLELIRDQQHKTGTREMLDDLVHEVSSGQSLSDAMARHERVFDKLYLSMVRVGETGGILEKTTSQLADILVRDEKIKTNMKNASAYPLFVLSLGVASVVIVITWILPKILATISGGAAALPLPTRILMGTSDFLRGVFTTFVGWLGVLAVLGGLFYVRRWTRTAGRVRWDAFKLRIPVLGSVLRTIAVGRFARTLGALTKGGVTILEALAVVRDTMGNELLGREIDVVAERVKRGDSLAEPLGDSGYFPPLLVQIVAIGEQTGKLDELLLNAAETFDTEADSAINRFIAIFPAILILILALVIGFIIAATLLPIVVMELGAGAM